MIFISSPYSSTDPVLVQERVDTLLAFMAERYWAGDMVMSPVALAHQIVLKHELPGDWAFWKNLCITYLSPAEKVYLLKIDGWDTSTGVAAELEFCALLGKTIVPFTVTYKEDGTPIFTQE